MATINDNNVSNNATTYWIFDNQRAESDTANAESNWWGTTIEAEIQVKIFDSNDDITKGTVDYVPFLTSPSTSPPPSPPTNLTGEASGTSASLFWAANPEGEITGYQVYYDTDSTGNPYDGTGGAQGISPIDVGNVTTFTISGLIPGATYFIAVTALDNRGSESWFSNEVSITTASSTELDVSLSKTDSSDPVAAGAELTYVLKVTNETTGASVATGLFVTDTLPGGVTFKSSTPSQGTVDPVMEANVVWNVGTLSSGQSETLEIQVTVDPATPDGTILTNNAVIEGDQLDPNPANNTVAETTMVVVPVCTLDLTPSYTDGTLMVDVLVGTNVAVTANLWGTGGNNIISLFSGPVPVIEPPINAPIAKPLPPSGTVGILATLTLPGLGLICSDFTTVDTGAPP